MIFVVDVEESWPKPQDVPLVHVHKGEEHDGRLTDRDSLNKGETSYGVGPSQQHPCALLYSQIRNLPLYAQA